jgi:hypothetical protein
MLSTVQFRTFCLLVYNKTYSTIIFLVVLYGCETWAPTLRKENELKVFENRVPRRIFVPEREMN